MVNTNIQGVIPLQGRGYCRRPFGGYEPGEYSRLVNTEITSEGVLVPRKSVVPYMADTIRAAAGPPGNLHIADPRDIIGSYGDRYDDSIIVNSRQSTGSLYAYNPPSGTPTALAMTGRNSTVTHPGILANYMVKFIRYNRINHFVSIAYFNGSINVYVHRTTTTALDAAEGPPQPLYTDYNHYLVGTISYGPGYNPPRFIDAFVIKDRLWIVMDRIIYFSKATDFSDWTSGPGGFIQFDDDYINTATPLKSSIAVFGDRTSKVVSFTDNFNTDGSITVVSNVLGARASCNYQDTAVFINGDSLYALSNGFINKIRDLDIDMPISVKVTSSSGPFQYRKIVPILTSYMDNIVISYREEVNTNSEAGKPYRHPLVNCRADSSSGIKFGFTYFLNMSTGCLWEFTFNDALELNVNPTWPGWVNNFEVYNNNIYFITLRSGNMGSLYIIDYNNTQSDANFSYDSFDHVVRVTVPAFRKQSIEHIIEIDSFAPDGTEMFMKKYRGLMMDALLPQFSNTLCNLSLYVAYGDTAVWTFKSKLSNDPAVPVPTNRPPSSFRYPFNQRARAVSLRFLSSVLFDLADATDGTTSKYTFSDVNLFSLHRLLVLWSYTQRAPVRNQTSDV